VDLKTTFDKVDRNRLWKELRRKGVKEDLVRGVKKVYEETEDGTNGTRTFKELQDDERSTTRMCDESTSV